MAIAKKSNDKQGNGANLGFEAKLWQAADKLRNNMDAAEYKHVVLGLIFLKLDIPRGLPRGRLLMKECE